MPTYMEEEFKVPDYQLQAKLRAERKKQASDMVADANRSIEAGKDGRLVGGVWIAPDNRGDLLKSAVGSALGYFHDKEAQTEAEELKNIRAELLKRMPSSSVTQERAMPEGIAGPGEAEQVRNPQFTNQMQQWGANASRVPGLEDVGKASLRAAIEAQFREPKEDAGYTLGEGQVRYDARGNRLAAGPAKPAEKQPQSVQEYNFAVSQGYKGGYSDWLKDKTSATTRIHVAAPQRDRFQVVTDEDGSQFRLNLDTLEKSPIGVSKGRPLTETQGNATLFGTRMTAANKVLEEIGTGYSPMKTAIARGAENIPGVNAGANSMLSGNEQRVLQAQRDFVNAVLRKESGAAINQSEFNNAQKQYFPQVGDTPDVLAQKKVNRELAIKGMKTIAGRGASGSFDAVPDAAPASGAVQVKNASDYAKLPRGAKYIDPQGNRRTKP